MTISLSRTPLRCTWEWQIISVSNTIREKPEWWVKYKDAEIATKWKSELLQQLPEDMYREAVIDYAINELEYYESLRNNTDGKFEAGCDVRIFVSSERVVSDELKQRFVSQVRQLLENIPESNKDWHPGSNGQVLDLVHPSLYPLQLGVTPVRQDDGSLKPLAMVVDTGDIGVRFGTASNSVYQWLPSVFKITENSSVSIESYINNLHPETCRALYQPIADIFAASIPAIEACLTQSISEQLERVSIPDPYDLYTEEFRARVEATWEREDVDNDALYEEIWDTRADHLKPIDIKWKGLLPPVEESRRFRLKQYNELKIIVKLANIQLTPENPKYPGGTWHLEGTQREDIIATVLYYYDIENISDSRLSFRASVDEPGYEQNDDIGLRVVFGLEDEDLLFKNLGSVLAKENRILVFPNVMQHRVEPFELLDPTKPGHRKILCFFITDPTNTDIVATDRVPPQQRDWWAENVRHTESSLSLLPQELFEMILDNVEWPMSLDKAKEIREKLMAERSTPEQEDDANYSYPDRFSLCEH